MDTLRGIPSDMLTDSRDGMRRLAVDGCESTGFCCGRIFRAYKELSIGTGGSYTVRMVLPSNTVLWRAPLAVDAGSLRLSLLLGGSPSGNYSETLPVLAQNAMSSVPDPAPTAQAVLTAGGSVSGGIAIEGLRLRASAQSLVTPASVRNSIEGPIGLAPGTYYFKLDNFGVDTLTGSFGLLWEER